MTSNYFLLPLLRLGAPINKAKLAIYKRQAMSVQETSLSTVSKIMLIVVFYLLARQFSCFIYNFF